MYPYTMAAIDNNDCIERFHLWIFGQPSARWLWFLLDASSVVFRRQSTSQRYALAICIARKLSNQFKP